LRLSHPAQAPLERDPSRQAERARTRLFEIYSPPCFSILAVLCKVYSRVAFDKVDEIIRLRYRGCEGDERCK
jgi:hypothetical protein